MARVPTRPPGPAALSRCSVQPGMAVAARPGCLDWPPGAAAPSSRGRSKTCHPGSSRALLRPAAAPPARSDAGTHGTAAHRPCSTGWVRREVVGPEVLRPVLPVQGDDGRGRCHRTDSRVRHGLPAVPATRVPPRRLLQLKANSSTGMQADMQQIQAPAGLEATHQFDTQLAQAAAAPLAPPACGVNPVAPTRQHLRPDLLHAMLAVPTRPLVRRAAPRTVLFIRPPCAHHGPPAGRAAIQLQWVHAHEAGRGWWGWWAGWAGWAEVGRRGMGAAPSKQACFELRGSQAQPISTACNCAAMTAGCWATAQSIPAPRQPTISPPTPAVVSQHPPRAHRNSCSRSMNALMLAGEASTSNRLTTISLPGCSSTDRLDTWAGREGDQVGRLPAVLRAVGHGKASWEHAAGNTRLGRLSRECSLEA